jgi:predicted nucleotidyltransferase
MLLNKLQKKNLISCPSWLPDNCHYLVQMGSVAYGVSNDSSDMDLYGYAIPPKTMVFPHLAGEIPGFGRNIKKFEQWQEHHINDPESRKEYDFSVYSIVKYFNLVMENNPNMVDSLFVPQRCILHCSKTANLIRESRDLFLHKGAFHKFKGYAFSQVHKMRIKGHKHIEDLMEMEDEWGIPRNTTLSDAENILARVEMKDDFVPYHPFDSVPPQIMKEYVELYRKMVEAGKRSERCKIHGFDVKFAYHVVRLVSEIEQILRDHTLVLDEKGRREHMKAIRNGEWGIDQVEDYFNQKERQLEDLYHTSKLQHSPDQEKIRDLLLNCLEEHYGSLDSCIVRDDQAVRALREISEIIDRNRKII